MSIRVQVLLNEQEKRLFQHQATLEGLSLSGWLRNAARERLDQSHAQRHIQTLEELQHFFQDCDVREHGKEPDWLQHLEVIERSRRNSSIICS